jgi:SAM-dependent methyltransferase
MQKGLANVEAVALDAEGMPFADQSFDLVTCRLAAHHFADVDRFLREAGRVLRATGLLAVVDNFVPGSDRRGKKARMQRQAGQYVNAFERLRDPSHHRCLSVSAWRAAFYNAGFAVEHEAIARKAFEIREWARRAGVPSADLPRLRALLKQAPQEVLEFLTPVFRADTIEFYLSELLIIGRKRAEKLAMA